ncbi:3-deoxy-D-manno-octulosonic acid kinase [Marinagarivorans algicola]|uniref:3-deoxy-D-manno-octulosonic acid kinase n=1 Tax=Marinagarivorans algicola TaxID=1513270 RepID=UPI0006B5C717|nr:3-deoxy-D-manno-octulosonic acid kinase [Marinagarivorans algicola]
MPHITPLTRNTVLLQSHNQEEGHITSQWFEPDYWQSSNSITGHTTGRATTYFIKHATFKGLVLRHYYRGGMVRHFLKDRYLYTGLKNTRAYAELEMLEKVQQWGLAAPKAVAGLVQRRGLFYRADLLMEQIPNARDLFQELKSSRLSASTWQSIGRTVAQFHQHGVYHADLNCHNIMRDNTGKIWLIDFDRASLKPTGTGWAAENIGRLYRSLTKELERSPPFYFDDTQWEAFLAGYDTK